MKFVSKLYLCTERGASRHCKILDTNKAWEQFDKLEESYLCKQDTDKLYQPYDDIKSFSLGDVANLTKMTIGVMSRQGSPTIAIARQTKLLYEQFGIETIPDFVYVPSLEQLSLI